MAGRPFPREIAGDQILAMHRRGALAACKPVCVFRAVGVRRFLLKSRLNGWVEAVCIEPEKSKHYLPTPFRRLGDGSVFEQAGAKLNSQLFI